MRVNDKVRFPLLRWYPVITVEVEGTYFHFYVHLFDHKRVTRVIVYTVPLHAHTKPNWAFFHRRGLYQVIINYNIFRCDRLQLSQKRIFFIMMNHHVVSIREWRWYLGLLGIHPKYHLQSLITTTWWFFMINNILFWETCNQSYPKTLQLIINQWRSQQNMKVQLGYLFACRGVIWETTWVTFLQWKNDMEMDAFHFKQASWNQLTGGSLTLSLTLVEKVCMLSSSFYLFKKYIIKAHGEGVHEML